MKEVTSSVFVMDCSVTMAIVLPDEKNKTFVSYVDPGRENTMLVPTIWHYEIANVLSTATRAKRITESELLEIKSILGGFPITTDDLSTNNCMNSTLNISREHKLSIYDAAYLELAMREGLPLATFDKQLIKIAKLVGLKII